MHICFISSEYPIYDLPHGGVGTFIRNLSYKLVQKGIQVSIVRMSESNLEEVVDDNGVVVYLFPNRLRVPPVFYSNAVIINKVIKKINTISKIDVIETPELGLAFINKIKGIKYVIRMNGGHHFFAFAEKRPTEWRKVWQEKRSFKKADHIIAVSEYVANTTKEILHLKKTITIIYNPIDSKRFYQSNPAKIKPYSVFFAGTLIEKKGIRQLIQSLNYLIDEFPKIKLYIAGRDAVIPGTKTIYRPILEKEITEKLKEHIEFLGVIPNFDIPKYIEASEVCCYPSHMEAMPLAWLEVLAMGKIFIGSKTGPGPEAVEDKITGLLVNPYDPKDIAEKIRFVFANKTEAQTIGANARKKIIKDFDVDVMVEKNIAFFESIIQK